MSKTIRIAAALLIRGDGQTLLVRKRDTLAFMQPGGKIDAGEQPAEALVRELREELNLRIDPSEAVYLGQFSAPAVTSRALPYRPSCSRCRSTLPSPLLPRLKRCAGSIPWPKVTCIWRR